MHRAEEIVEGEKLEGMLTIQQLSQHLHVSYSRAAAIVQELQLPFRYATKQEEDVLLERGLIAGLPATAQPGRRVKLLPGDIVTTARERRKRGWQKGVSRSKAERTTE